MKKLSILILITLLVGIVNALPIVTFDHDRGKGVIFDNQKYMYVDSESIIGIVNPSVNNSLTIDYTFVAMRKNVNFLLNNITNNLDRNITINNFLNDRTLLEINGLYSAPGAIVDSIILSGEGVVSVYDGDEWRGNIFVTPEPSTIFILGIGCLLINKSLFCNK